MNARESKKSEKLSGTGVLTPSGTLPVGVPAISGTVVLTPSGTMPAGVTANRGAKRINPSMLVTEMPKESGTVKVCFRAAYEVAAAPRAIMWQGTQGKTTEYSVTISDEQTLVFSVPTSRQAELNGRIMELFAEYSDVLKTKARLNPFVILAGEPSDAATAMLRFQHADHIIPQSLIEPAPLHAKHEAILNKIFAASDWYDTLAICKGAGFSDSNPSAQPNRWKRDGKVFALRRGKSDVYPAYAFGDDFRPLPAMKDVLCVFKGKKTDLKIAAWFASVNSWLRDQRPLDVIGTNPDAVINAAKAEVAPIDHG